MEKYIQFNTEVLSVERFKGKWKVKTTKENPARVFDLVCVSSGFFSRPHIPFNLDRFKGRIYHSSQYKDPSIFRGKHVLVVGGAFSGSEIAADIAIEADKTTLLARRPMYYIPRKIDNVPVDLVFYRFEKKKGGSDLEAKHRFLASVMRNSISPKHVERVRFPMCLRSNPTYVYLGLFGSFAKSHQFQYDHKQQIRSDSIEFSSESRSHRDLQGFDIEFRDGRCDLLLVEEESVR